MLNRCYVCKEEEEEEEMLHHILCHCLKVVILQYLIYALFRLEWGDSLLDIECSPKLAQRLRWEKEEESLESCSLMPILDHMEAEKQASVCELVKKQVKQLNNHSCIFFFGDCQCTQMDFTIWLNSMQRVGLVFVYPFTWYDLLVTVYTMYTLVHNFVRRC